MAVYDPQKDPAAVQMPAGYAPIYEMGTDFLFTSAETEILRSLAARVAEAAARPDMKKKADLWTRHNDLKTDTPLVFIDPEYGWNELVPPGTLGCMDPLARTWEMYLRKLIYWADVLKDDRVITGDFDVPFSFQDTGWGISEQKTGEKQGNAYHIEAVLEDFKADFEKLHHPEIIIQREESDAVMELAHAVFDGILRVRRKHAWWWTLGLGWDYVFLRGMENYMCDFLVEPEWTRRLLDFLCEGKLKMLDFLQENHLLTRNTGATYVGSGGFGFTNALPSEEENSCGVKLSEMWGFCDAQETAQMSPAFYGEFLLPLHQKILGRFGLSCYGCCEGYESKWEYVKQLPNLRRVSVSPWAKWETVPENLGKDYIASVKPNPSPLAERAMDEEAVRRDCREAAEKTKGGICEFIMKDNHTLGNNPDNATRWTQIMREEIDRVY